MKSERMGFTLKELKLILRYMLRAENGLTDDEWVEVGETHETTINKLITIVYNSTTNSTQDNVNDIDSPDKKKRSR